MLFFLSFINEIWLTEYYDYSVHIEEISKLQQKKLHFSQNVISSVSKPQYPNLLIVSCINSLIPLLHEHYFELSNIIDNNIFRCLFYFMQFSLTYLSNCSYISSFHIHILTPSHRTHFTFLLQFTINFSKLLIKIYTIYLIWLLKFFSCCIINFRKFNTFDIKEKNYESKNRY